jgi:hypothetical protein
VATQETGAATTEGSARVAGGRGGRGRRRLEGVNDQEKERRQKERKMKLS